MWCDSFRFPGRFSNDTGRETICGTSDAVGSNRVYLRFNLRTTELVGLGKTDLAPTWLDLSNAPVKRIQALHAGRYFEDLSATTR